MRKILPTEEDLGDGGEPADITPFQKMLSATTGSLLTGLTSMPSRNQNRCRKSEG